jgi:hypothetical protein
MAHTEKIAKTEYAKQLQLQVRLNIFICLVDWVGMFMHAFTVFYESRHNTLIHAISTALVGCHTHLICHVYMGMMVLVRQSPVVKRESEVRLEPIIQSLELETGLGLEFVQ